MEEKGKSNRRILKLPMSGTGMSVLLVLIAIAVASLVVTPVMAQHAEVTATTTAVSEIYEPGLLDVYGNANEDDTIDMRDTTYIKLVIFGKKPKTDLADANYDGKVSMLDVGQTKLIILGKDKELTLKDNGEATVTIQKPVNRAIYLTHNTYVYETLRALDVGDSIIGITERFVKPGGYRYSENYFPELLNVKCIGTYALPDYEEVLNLHPDLVYIDKYIQTSPREELPGISAVDLDMVMETTTVDFTKIINKIGYIYDKREAAEEYIDWRNGWVNTLKERTERLSADKKPLVLLTSYKPEAKEIKVSTGESLEHPMIVIAGGRNIGEEFSGPWSFSVDLEWIIEQNPDIVILKTAIGDESGFDFDSPAKVAAIRADFMNRPEFANLKAVKNGNVYTINYAHLVVGGASSLIGTAYFAKWCQPDLFEDLEPEAILQEFLDRFQHIDFDVKEHGVFVYHPEKHQEGW